MPCCSPSCNESPEAIVAQLGTDISAMIRDGGSLLRSNALHAACASNSIKVVDVILRMQPETVNSVDSKGLTPLMMAAQCAAGRCSISGIAEIQVIERLIQAGANKSLTDPSGMTAYGHYKKGSQGYHEMMMAVTGGHIGRQQIVLPSLLALEAQLCPPGGPTAGDQSLGKGGNTGFVDNTHDDYKMDEEMDMYDDVSAGGDY